MPYLQLFPIKSRSISKSFPYKQLLINKKLNKIQFRTRNIAPIHFNTQCIPAQILHQHSVQSDYYANLHSNDYTQSPAMLRLREHIKEQKKIISQLSKDVSYLKTKMKRENVRSALSKTLLKQEIKMTGLIKEYEIIKPINDQLFCQSCINMAKLNNSNLPKHKPATVNIEFKPPAVMRISESTHYKGYRPIKLVLGKKPRRSILMHSLICIKPQAKEINANATNDKINELLGSHTNDHSKQDMSCNSFSWDSNDEKDKSKIELPRRRIILIKNSDKVKERQRNDMGILN